MQWSLPVGANTSGSKFIQLNHPTGSRGKGVLRGWQPLTEGQAETGGDHSPACQNPESKGCFYSLKSKSTTLGPDLPYTEANVDFAINVTENVRAWRHFPGTSLKLPCNKQQKSFFSFGNFKRNL